MRTARSLTLLAVLFAAPAAKAGDADPASEPGAQAAADDTTAVGPDATAEKKTEEPEANAEPALPWFGVMADAGLPDGMQGAIVLRPERWLRASVGGGYNMISKGVRAGLSILPFGRGPSVTIEAGRYFEGDANGVARKFLGLGANDNAVLERIAYDYANAHLGLDFGYKRVTFFIHGGLTYLRGTVHNLDQALHSSASINNVDSNGLEVSVKQDPTVKIIGPSAKLGLIVYLW
jgi:hypothetical protein